MGDYVYPSIFFSYFIFFLLMFGALYFCLRSMKQGYWGEKSEDAKYRMLKDDDELANPEELPIELRN